MDSNTTDYDKGPVRRHVRTLPLYVPGRRASVAQEHNMPRLVRLASNENPRGCSPNVANALIKHLSGTDDAIARYPDSEAIELRTALAHHHNVPTDFIAVTNGSHELVDLCAALSLSAENSGMYSQYAFQAYPISIRARGAVANEVPARNFGHDSDAMCASFSASTRLVYICNPNNPTGTLLSHSEIERILVSAGRDCLVVLDEAYVDYLDPSARPDSLGLVVRYPNLIVARTFSKAYGLASLRVGYGIMQPELAKSIARVRPTFSVNALAQIAALAALRDQSFLIHTHEENRKGIALISSALESFGIPFIPTHANFITFQLDRADVVTEKLLSAGVVVRPLGAYGLDDHIRVTVGTGEENELFLHSLREAMRAG